jgi:hypothetical protein
MIVHPFMARLRVRSCQLLADDPTKRAIYTDAHSSGMVPRWRDMATIITTKIALIEAPPPESLPFSSAVDWAKIYKNNLMISLLDMVAFADAWTAIERWWAIEDYSVRAAGPGRAGIRPLMLGYYAATGDAANHPLPRPPRVLDDHDHDGEGDGEGARAAGRVERPFGRRVVCNFVAGPRRRRCGGRGGHDLGPAARPRGGPETPLWQRVQQWLQL